MKRTRRPQRKWILGAIALVAIALAFHMLRRDDPDPRELAAPDAPLLEEETEASE